MKIILCDKQKSLVDACKDTEGAEIIHGDLLRQKFDAIAVPGNSFGFMSGDFDKQMLKKYGNDIEKDIKRIIELSGEIPIGEAIVRTPYPLRKQPIVILAPTMRVPMDIRANTNVYLAMRAAFMRAAEINISVLIMPGFGTGWGTLPVKIFAKQFQAAVNDYKNPPKYRTWRDAQRAHFDLAII